MDKPDQQDSHLELAIEIQSIARGVDMVFNVWVTAIGAAICVVYGIVELSPLAFIMAGLGAVSAFVGWCFAQAY
jgi:membrane protein YqaA with SNARE-associated domain